MAAKQEQCKKNRSFDFSASSCKPDTKRSKRKSFRHKVCKLFSKLNQFSRKVEVDELSSPSLPGLSPKIEVLFLGNKEVSCAKNMSPKIKALPSETHEMPFLRSDQLSLETTEVSKKGRRLPLKTKELYSNTTTPFVGLNNLSPDTMEVRELSLKTEELCLDTATPFFGLHKQSPDTTEVSTKDQRLSLNTEDSRSKKRRNVEPEIFIFPPNFSKLSFEIDDQRKFIKPQRSKSEKTRGLYCNEQQQRPRIVSEPCINKCAQIISSRGIKLTEAANELSEEQCRLLYEDIFKPLDFFSILQERMENLPEDSQFEKDAFQ